MNPSDCLFHRCKRLHASRGAVTIPILILTAAVLCPCPSLEAASDRVVISPSPGFTIAWDGNNGGFNNPAEGAGPSNNVALASNGTVPFTSSDLGLVLGISFHVAANLNDGLYGNSRSWISDFTLPDPNPWVGLHFDGSVNVSSVAWGRDNGNTVSDACGGTCLDRNVGVYTLQYTLVAVPGAATPDTDDPFTGWATLGTIQYLPGADNTEFTGYLRHRFDVAEAGAPIEATGLRIKVSDPNLAIDEIEVNPIPDPVLPVDLGIDIVSQPGFAIDWDGNQGQFFSPESVAPVPPNRALISEGTVPFTSSDLGPLLGIPFHVAANLNDGRYGNGNSWISANGIGGTSDTALFAGLNFGSPVLITNIAWGRDNGNTTSDACGGTCTDRSSGPYLLQYTLVTDPGVSTPDTDDPFTGWASIGTVTLGPPLPPNFFPHLRHRFEVSEFGNPIEATGIRIKVPDGLTAIDEIEINTPVTLAPPDPIVVLTPQPGFAIGWDGNEGNFSTPADPAPVPANIAQSGTAFGSSALGPALGLPFHIVANINDGFYGNAYSWIPNFTLPDPNPFIGVNLGAVTPITSIAWGRDNGNVAGDCCGGTLTDRALGLYTLQITTRTDADAATPETGDAATGWQTLATIDYKRNEPPLFNSHLRHRFDVAAGGMPVAAAAIRIKVPDANSAIDEIEINPNQAVEQGLLVVAGAPGFTIAWDGNEGDFFSPDAGASPPPNLALASEGTVPFTSSDLGPLLGIPFHIAANLNDGRYGNAHSWISANGIGGATDPDPFAGLSFDGLVAVQHIAWGRDNGDTGEGTFTDRTGGSYRLQYTLVDAPNAATPDTGDPFTGWADIGTVSYGPALPPAFQPHLRHRFELSAAGNPVEATGIRIKVPNGSIAIDEIEVNIQTPNLPPVCTDGLAQTAEDTSVTITLAAVDPEGGAVTFFLVDGPSNGTATLAGNLVTYTPNPNVCGNDQFTFKASDPAGAESEVCTVTITVLPVNDPPSALVEISPLSDLGPSTPGNIVISANNATACVTLDASQSTDLDAETGCGSSGSIHFLWIGPDGSPLGAGPVIEACLPVGSQEITLILDDGKDTGGTVVVVDVLTGCEAVEALIQEVNDSVIARQNKRPFLATLKETCAAFDRGSTGSALNRLENAFKNKVRAQVGKDNPDVAEDWIGIAQEIIDAYSREQTCDDCE